MVINHYGLGMVKIQLGERVIVFNPIGSGAAVEPTRFGADLALVSLHDEAYEGVREVSRGDRVPFVIDGPGEYEVDGVFIRGFQTAGPGGKLNTVYLLTLDNMRLVHLGALTEASLPGPVVEALGAIDVLFVPVGGETLDTKMAVKIATSLEPKTVVPTHYNAAELKAFAKEMGEESAETLTGWTIKKKDLADKSGDLVIIKSN